jgi:flagellar biosynthetic protein FliR
LGHTTLAETARLLGLGALRTVPLVLAVPVLGGPALPMQLRFALGLGMSVLCMPVLVASPDVPGSLAWALLAAREVLVGLVTGFVVACVFRAAQAAGELTDVLRGDHLTLAPSPTGDGHASPLGALLLLFASVVFLEIGGVGHVASALARSYEAIPLGMPIHAESARASATLAIVASGKLIEAAIGLAAPAMVALLLADIALGIIGRAVPRMSIHQVGKPLRALVGLGAVLLGLGATDLALQHGFRDFFDLLVTALRPGH